MRVITTYGSGTAGGRYPRDGSQLAVTLDVPYLNQTEVSLAWLREAFPLSGYAAIRVLSVTGIGLVSNVRFRPTWYSARYETAAPRPADETVLALDLKRGLVESTTLNRIPDAAALSIESWVDRWGPERGQHWADVAEALTRWDETSGQLAGTSGGIAASAVVDLTTGRLRRFCLVVPPPVGTVFRFADN